LLLFTSGSLPRSLLGRHGSKGYLTCTPKRIREPHEPSGPRADRRSASRQKCAGAFSEAIGPRPPRRAGPRPSRGLDLPPRGLDLPPRCLDLVRVLLRADTRHGSTHGPEGRLRADSRHGSTRMVRNGACASPAGPEVGGSPEVPTRR
jgi:hypothetical protein